MKKIKNILYYFSKSENDKRKLLEYQRIKEIIQGYSGEQLMAEYFDLKSKIEYMKNMTNFFIICTVTALITNSLLAYTGYFKTYVIALFSTTDVSSGSDLQIFKIVLLLSGIIFITVVLILLYLVHSNIKGLAEKNKYLLLIDIEKERRDKMNIRYKN
ncbi:hypothetical protein RZE82_07175 [Mollicutes bacterium LVI A0039]|nr:hypothetical protein RZE82_07175 [Mollicutes bacterium LVI A0039]